MLRWLVKVVSMVSGFKYINIGGRSPQVQNTRNPKVVSVVSGGVAPQISKSIVKYKRNEGGVDGAGL